MQCQLQKLLLKFLFYKEQGNGAGHLQNKAASEGLPCFKKWKKEKKGRGKRTTKLCLHPCLQPDVKSTHARGASHHFCTNSLYLLPHCLPDSPLPLPPTGLHFQTLLLVRLVSASPSSPLPTFVAPTQATPQASLFDSDVFSLRFPHTAVQLSAIVFEVHLLPSPLSLLPHSDTCTCASALISLSHLAVDDPCQQIVALPDLPPRLLLQQDF